MAMGPFRMGDLAGNDIGWAIRKRRYAENPDMTLFADRRPAVRAGPLRPEDRRRLVRLRAGRPRRAIPIAVVERDDRQAFARRSASTPRKISDEEIVERCVYALVNEGAHILEEGIAQRASDIDMVYLTGYGFPLYRGGPMLYADTVGLLNVVAAMEHFAKGRHGDSSGNRRRCSRSWPPKARRSIRRYRRSCQRPHRYSDQEIT